jgi:hypothetical protein
MPNPDRAVITSDKLVNYVLNVEHRRGGTKARALALFGYTPDNWTELETEIRSHLSEMVDVVRPTPWGMRYEIVIALNTPVGRKFTVRTVWQVDDGTDFPRLITLYPD